MCCLYTLPPYILQFIHYHKSHPRLPETHSFVPSITAFFSHINSCLSTVLAGVAVFACLVSAKSFTGTVKTELTFLVSKRVSPLCLLFFLFRICKWFSSVVSSVLCKKINTMYFYIMLTFTAVLIIIFCLSRKIKCSPHFCEYRQLLCMANNIPPQPFYFENESKKLLQSKNALRKAKHLEHHIP